MSQKIISCAGVAVTTVIALMLASSAHAGLILDRTSSKAPLPSSTQISENNSSGGSAGNGAFPHRRFLDLETYVTDRISQSGESPFDIAIVRGAGRDVALRESLHQILPLGWKVFTDGPVDTAKKFNWSGSKNWVFVLDSILATNGLNALVDWTNKEITLTIYSPVGSDSKYVKSNYASKSADQKNVTPSAISAKEKVGAEVQYSRSNDQSERIAPAAPVAVLSLPMAWTMVEEKTVKENLDVWISKMPGWRLIWSARKGDHIYDYPSKPFVGYTFNGELLGEKGVVSRVVAAFVDSNPALAVEFFTENKVVEITLYNPTGRQSVDELGQGDRRESASR